MNTLFGIFGAGRVAARDGDRETAPLPWTEHPSFKGVYLKTLVAEKDTGNALSCLLVRIEPGCAIGLHVHPASVELHEVVAGAGVCVLEEAELAYSPGTMAVMPANAPHEVRAGDKGLCLLAKFVTVRSENSDA